MARDRARRRARLRQKTADTASSTDNKRDGSDNFVQEYAYVLKDLRRIFILAAIMFILLIALNIVLL